MTSRPKQPVDHGNPLAGHPRYRKLQDLSSGAFGFVQVLLAGCRSCRTPVRAGQALS